MSARQRRSPRHRPIDLLGRLTAVAEEGFEEASGTFLGADQRVSAVKQFSVLLEWRLVEGRMSLVLLNVGSSMFKDMGLEEAPVTSLVLMLEIAVSNRILLVSLDVRSEPRDAFPQRRGLKIVPSWIFVEQSIGSAGWTDNQ